MGYKYIDENPFLFGIITLEYPLKCLNIHFTFLKHLKEVCSALISSTMWCMQSKKALRSVAESVRGYLDLGQICILPKCVCSENFKILRNKHFCGFNKHFFKTKTRNINELVPYILNKLKKYSSTLKKVFNQ